LGIRRTALAAIFVTSATAISACGGIADSSAPDDAEQTLGNRMPRVIETQTLAPLAGKLYTPAAGQEVVTFHGTDLGFTVAHKGDVRILFGDTWTDPVTNPFPHDDSQGVSNIVDCWTEDRKHVKVDLYWNVSTHNPYQVVLMKTPLAR
jgi:hypothetical protein